ncbi:RNA polymerase sigma factor [Acidicapsa dinghuensis]|uniref:RNA polymerase sigma factor n=1 Tax=Acidicapsa dinghuensis TaxID=2218256 RepID=A0ABW1EJU8_9BACT|nr:sigma-70 family RNA polymerase sigma factor [Acidicapsa dinghuensis]
MQVHPTAVASSHFAFTREEAEPTASGSSSRSERDSSTEATLVDRILSGDTQAFSAIVHRWQGPLINLAWRYCRDRARAEEMAQEAFIRAWRGLAQWRREGSFSTWLFSVAANVYRNELKRIAPINIPLDKAPEPAQPFLRDAELDGHVRDEAVRRAVLALPQKYREPVILFYFHEMDLSAAAATMGIPEGTMKARLSRARDILRHRFPQLRSSLDDFASEPSSATVFSSGFEHRTGREGSKGDRK